MTWLTLRRPPPAAQHFTGALPPVPDAARAMTAEKSGDLDDKVAKSCALGSQPSLAGTRRSNEGSIGTLLARTTPSSSSSSSLRTSPSRSKRSRTNGDHEEKEAESRRQAFSSRLSPEQKRVVEMPITQSRTLLVMAGAGAGKTSVIVGRVLRLVREEGVQEHNVLAITFSRKAAGEMQARFRKVLGNSHKVRVDNLHRLALHAIQEFGQGSDVLGFTMPSTKVDLLDEREESWLVEYACLRMLTRMTGMPSHEELMQVMLVGDKLADDDDDEDDGEIGGTNDNKPVKAKKPSTPALSWFVPNKFRKSVSVSDARKLRPVVRPSIVFQARAAISEIVSLMIPPASVAKQYGKELSQVYHLFKAFTSTLRMATMDMLVPGMVRLLQTRPGVQQMLARRHRCVFVDEVQDLSPVELELIALIARQPMQSSSTNILHHLVCVGDEDQAIYSFRNNSRAATSHSAFRILQDKFPDAVVVNLPVNYRCPAEVVSVANALIANNQDRIMLGRSMVHPSSAIPSTVEASPPALISSFSSSASSQRSTAASLMDGKTSSCSVIRLLPCSDPPEEASRVVELVVSTLKTHPGHSIGILGRSNRVLKLVELELRRNKVDVWAAGGINDDDDDDEESNRGRQGQAATMVGASNPHRPHPMTTTGGSGGSESNRMIRSVFAYARLGGIGQDPKELDEALKQVWLTRKGLGKKTWENLHKIPRKTPSETLYDVARRSPIEVLGGSSRKRQIAISSLLTQIASLRQQQLSASSSSASCLTFSDHLLEVYRSIVMAEERHLGGDREELDRADHLFQLLMIDCRELEMDVVNGQSREKILQQLEDGFLGMNRGKTDRRQSVVIGRAFLGTIHQAKGLEFDHVFLLRMNEGCLPSCNSSTSHGNAWFAAPDDGLERDEDEGAQRRVEEERRCAYVAVTRTRKSLTMSFASRDDEAGTMLTPSRFLDEMHLLSSPLG